jgi:hypothetical protein
MHSSYHTSYENFDSKIVATTDRKWWQWGWVSCSTFWRKIYFLFTKLQVCTYPIRPSYKRPLRDTSIAVSGVECLWISKGNTTIHHTVHTYEFTSCSTKKVFMGSSITDQKYDFTATMFNVGRIFPGFQPQEYFPSFFKCNFRLPLTKALDWNLERLNHERILTGFCIHLF